MTYEQRGTRALDWSQVVVTYNFNLITWEAEAGLRPVWYTEIVPGQASRLHRELCLEKKERNMSFTGDEL